MVNRRRPDGGPSGGSSVSVWISTGAGGAKTPVIGDNLLDGHVRHSVLCFVRVGCFWAIL